MTQDKSFKDDLSELRRRAEKASMGKLFDVSQVSATSPEEIQRLIQELQVYQIELEMQNEELRRTQQELAASRDKYLELYDYTPVGHFTLSQNGVICEVNLTGATLLGVEKGLLVGKPLASFVNKEGGDTLYKHFRQVLETQSKQTCDVQLANGNQVYLHLESQLLKSQEGSPTRFLTAALDISYRKQAQEALQESEANLMEAQRVTKIGNWSFDLITNKVTWSDELYRIFGIEKPDFDGRYELFVKLVHPDDQARVLETNLEARTDGSPFDLEYRVVTPDGQVKTIREIGYAKQDDEGKVVRIFGTAQDITARERADKAFRDSEKRYRLLFENMLEGCAYCKIIFEDGKLQDFVYLDVNDAFERMTGLKDVIGKKATEVIPGVRETNPEFFEIYSRVALTGNPEKFERCLDSLGIWLSVSVYSTKPEHFVAVFDNITERKRVEEALVKSEAELHAIYEYAPVMMCVLGEQRQVLYANRAFTEFLGKTESELKKGRACGVFGCDKALDDPLGCGYGPQCGSCSLRLAIEDTYEGGVDHRNIEWHSTLAVNDQKREVVLLGSTALIHEGERPSVLLCLDDITQRVRDQEALRESEERYRTVADFNYDWEYWIGTNDKLRYVSPSCERMTGYSVREFLDDTGLMERIVHPDDLDDVRKHFHLAREVEHETSYSIDFRIISRDGQVRWINHVCQPVFGKDGNPLGRRASSRDITIRKEIEKALKESETRYRSLIETASDAIFLMEGEHFVECNSRTLEIYGCTREQILGQKPSRFSPATQPDGRSSDDKASEFIDGALKGEPQLFEWRHMRLDGSIFDVEVSLNRVELEGRECVSAVVRDITDRKKAEEALRKSEALLNSIIEQSPFSMFICDREGTLIKINPACKKWFRVADADVIGKYNLLKDEAVDGHGFMPLVRRVFENGEQANFELEWDSTLVKHLGHKEAFKLMLSVTIFPVKDAEGRITNAV